jgi:regulator of protease activity HflC (stomatin/prohibitin superfamily)
MNERIKRIKEYIKSLWDRHYIKIVIGILIVLFFVAYLWRNIFYSINPGEAGVRWSRFFGGTVIGQVYPEGMHAIFPWDRMYIYNVRIQEIHDSLQVLSKNGLYVDVSWSGRFYPRHENLPMLHKRLGPDYIETVVGPEFVSGIRRIIGNYTEEEIYHRDEEGLLDEVYDRIKLQFAKVENLIVFQDILFKRLQLPAEIQKAIEDKIAQKQLDLSYEFRLQKEDKERQRKQIEADGIRQFEAISGISILKWRGIQATENLAQSENSKIVIIGTGPDGLPIILNTDK